MVYLDNDTYNNAVKEGIVLVEFGAEWCGPCKMMEPVLQELEQELAGKVTIAKVDVDTSIRTAQLNGIKSVPTIFIYKNGVLIERQAGAIPKSGLMTKLKKYL